MKLLCIYRPALEKLISRLTQKNYLDGGEVREIVNQFANPEDLKWRDAEKSEFL